MNRRLYALMVFCLCFCLPLAAWAQEEGEDKAEKEALALHQKTMKEARALHKEIQSLHKDLEATAQEVGKLKEEFVDADQKRRQEIDYQGRIKQQELERISAQLRDKQFKIFDLASKLIARDPGSVEFREMRCDAAFAKEAFDIVLEDIERVSQEKRESVDYLMIWGQSLERKARFKEAIEKYKKALAIIPKERQPFVRFSLANCHFNTHQFEEAFKYYAGLAADAPAAAKQQYENISKVAAEYVKLWEKELALRKEEEAKGTNPIVVLEVSGGEIKLELFEDQAPNMTANFIHLVESGFYDGLPFFKVVPQSMVVSGCPKGDGTGGPGYVVPDEFMRSGSRRHFMGSLAMDNKVDGTEKPNTAGSRFLITTTVQWWLNGRETVFGRVTEGLDVVHRIRQGDRIIAARVLHKRDHDYPIIKK